MMFQAKKRTLSFSKELHRFNFLFELWTDADKDQSISLELLNKVEEPDDKAGKFHFDEIASANDAKQTTFVEEGTIEVPPLGIICVFELSK